MARRTSSARSSTIPNRSASTAAFARPTAVPATRTAPPPVAVPQQHQQQQGILSQIATTAAGVAVGHTVGRMVTGLFSSTGDGNATAPTATNAVQERCAPDVQHFVECMNRHHEDMSACQHYYDLMRQCAGSGATA